MRWWYEPLPSPWVGAALLILRLVVGLAFVLHGRPKLRFPTRWMNEFGMRPAPPVLQLLATASEVGGGAALVLGLLTRLAALGIAGDMVGALAMVHLPARQPFVSAQGPSFEVPAVYLAIALFFLAYGPGPWSLDALLFAGR